jgi:hypothetical protein
MPLAGIEHTFNRFIDIQSTIALPRLFWTVLFFNEMPVQNIEVWWNNGRSYIYENVGRRFNTRKGHIFVYDNVISREMLLRQWVDIKLIDKCATLTFIPAPRAVIYGGSPGYQV